MMKILLVLFLQARVANDISDLRKFLGADFTGVIQLLVPSNDLLLDNMRRKSPAKAAEMEAQMAIPSSLGESEKIVPLTLANRGRGLVTRLFDGNFQTERVNLVFCHAAPRRILALQVLFEDRRGTGSTVDVLRNVYQMPQPSNFETYKPAIGYSLRGVTYTADGGWTKLASAPPVTVFDLGEAAEAVYQPVDGDSLVNGILWIGDKKAATTCPPPPAQ